MPGPPPELRRGSGLNIRATGDLGEEIARRYLAREGRARGEQLPHSAPGELDLISRHNGTPLEAVTLRKQEAIRLMAEEYLAEESPEFQSFRFDVVAILLRGEWPEMTYVEEAL